MIEHTQEEKKGGQGNENNHLDKNLRREHFKREPILKTYGKTIR